MTEIVKGLFGVTPDELAQQRNEQLNTQASAFAQMSPEQQATYSLYRGGNQLAGAVGGLLGAQDPQLKKSADLQAILQQFDMTTPEGLMQAGKAAQAKGYGNEAMQAFAKAREMQAASMKEMVDRSIVQKNISDKTTNEVKNAVAVANSVAEQGTPEWKVAYQAKLKELTTKSDGAPKKVGIAEGSREVVFQDPATDQLYVYRKGPDGKQVRIEYNGGVDQTTSKTNVNVKGDAQETEFAKQLGKGQATAILDSKVGAQDAATILQTNDTAKKILNAGAITGTGAQFFIGVNNALKQAGIETTSTDAAANSQAYVATMGANVGKLIKQFGAGTGLSDADRKFAADMAGGNITLTEQSMRKIIDINDRAATNVIKRHNESVKGIQTNIPLEVKIPTTSLGDKKARLAELERKAKAGGQ